MPDVLIAGGGLAGGAAAILLAQSGRSVHLIDRHAGPEDKICGEFLSIEAQHHLDALGIDLDAMGAVPVTHIRLFAQGRRVETRLPFTARGISRRILDEALLTRASAAGAHVERGVKVVEATSSGFRTNRGERSGATLMLATGKMPVRETVRAAGGARHDAYVGYKMHLRASAKVRAMLDSHIELVLFRGGYAGLQMVAHDIANLCLVVRRSELGSAGSSWPDIWTMIGGLSPGLCMLADAEPLFDKPLTIANLAYGRLPANSDGGIFRLGDQAAMTASLTGDGMAIALRSAWLAARLHLSGRSAADYHDALKRMVGPQVRRGMILQRGTEMPLVRQIGLGLLRIRPDLLRFMTAMTRLPTVAPNHP